MSVPDRPAFDDAGIWCRPDGRQMCISTGRVDTSDRKAASPQLLEGLQVPHPPAPILPPEPVALKSGGTRQKITGFSDRSRRNLREWVHAVKRDAESLFLTLTYHKADRTPQAAKEDLDRFCKRLARRFPEAAVIWKMEPQERGVPHFHLLVYNVPFIPVQKIAAVWHDCTPETSEQHRKAGVDLERSVQSDDDKLQAYLCKYMDKTFDTDWESPGRFWGIRQRSNLPLARWEKVTTLTRDEAQRVIMGLLDRWGVELPDVVNIPTLRYNTASAPAKEIGRLP